MIKVVVVGAAGKMGREICKAILDDPETELYGAVDIKEVGKDIGELLGRPVVGVHINSLKRALSGGEADVLVDFTHAGGTMDNVRMAANSGLHMVIGTTGLTEENKAEVKKLCSDNNVNALIAPNFAIGAVLMMKFAEMAARYMNRAEIIELHHDQKRDAPSGTAMQTAKLISSKIKGPQTESEEILAGSLGGKYENVRVHSVRLPGFVAHQEVIFGGVGQVLTIRHDSIDRTSFMPGVLMAIKAISEYPGVTIGLDKIMDL
ncbi:MAG TPA: 4-hydroxy-tetrahydrodipicolinate reductase [Anaerolineae bacterium]|jgi:4-hydroxy-tetrahydrodipicolinate reductase|nr:4-hydroxy-tetrahydrodipicolinate reductase [Anaerolineae bacterium]